jgi:hypothetical protein
MNSIGFKRAFYGNHFCRICGFPSGLLTPALAEKMYEIHCIIVTELAILMIAINKKFSLSFFIKFALSAD